MPALAREQSCRHRSPAITSDRVSNVPMLMEAASTLPLRPPPVSVQDVISPGSVNDNQVRFARPGRYAMVCFFGAHDRLGMYRIFRVR